MADAFITAVRQRLHAELYPEEETGQSGPPPGVPRPQPSTQPPTRKRGTESAAAPSAPSSSHTNATSYENVTGDAGHKTAKRRKTKPASSTAERGARYRPHPSKAVLDRHTRSLRHRLFLIDREPACNGHEAMFAVMGANGNVYRCGIGTQPSCTCPDFTKRVDGSMHGPCKHLIFIFMRVFKVSKEDPVWWQTRLLPDEVETILRDAPTTDADHLVGEEVRQRYREESSRRKPIEGDCPICFEDLGNGDFTRPDDVITCCVQCGNHLHKNCVQNWARFKNSVSSCPVCRGDRFKDNLPSDRPEEFSNLASFSSAHERQMTLAELYADTHQFIGRPAGRG